MSQVFLWYVLKIYLKSSRVRRTIIKIRCNRYVILFWIIEKPLNYLTVFDLILKIEMITIINYTFDNCCLTNLLLGVLINCKVITDDLNMMMWLFYIFILHIKLFLVILDLRYGSKIIKKNILVFVNWSLR